MRTPLVTKGERGSSGIVFLFSVMPAAIERLLRDLAGELAVERAQVDEHQMVVGAAGHEPEPLGREARGERLARSARSARRTR